MNRRHFLYHSLAAAALTVSQRSRLKAASYLTATVPVRAITHGPKFHWFGYYDKFQFDPTGRYVLGMEVDFEHRSPTAQDVIRIGLIDLQDNDRWTEIGTSNAWGWQQGCMLQWIPGSTNEVIWNDRVGNHFMSHILNVKTGKKRTLPQPIYALSPDGKTAIGVDFSRLDGLRPGYGYAGIPDRYAAVKAPKEIGLYRMDLATGKHQLLFSIADIASLTLDGTSLADNYHWFNHLLFNNDGSRFLFLNRWRSQLGDRQTIAKSGFTTRMFTADADGKNLYCIDPSGNTSHFVWKDPRTVCAFTKPKGEESGFYLLEDFTGHYTRIGREKMPVNGHQTYLPIGNGMTGLPSQWILNDNYAGPKDRTQTPYLYHLPTDTRTDLGHFPSPLDYTGEWRCDLHPRANRDGTMVCIDSAHGGNGRQMYLMDIHNVLKS
jgi:hypothetical protein